MEIVRCAQRGRFVCVSQFLLGQMIEFLVLSFGLACLLPEFIRASDDVNFGWLIHFLASFTEPAVAALPGALGLGVSGGMKLRTVNDPGVDPFLSRKSDRRSDSWKAYSTNEATVESVKDDPHRP